MSWHFVEFEVVGLRTDSLEETTQRFEQMMKDEPLRPSEKMNSDRILRERRLEWWLRRGGDVQGMEHSPDGSVPPSRRPERSAR